MEAGESEEVRTAVDTCDRYGCWQERYGRGFSPPGPDGGYCPNAFLYPPGISGGALS